MIRQLENDVEEEPLIAGKLRCSKVEVIDFMEFRDAKPQDYEGIVHCIYHGFEHHFKHFKTSEISIKKIVVGSITVRSI